MDKCRRYLRVAGQFGYEIYKPQQVWLIQQDIEARNRGQQDINNRLDRPQDIMDLVGNRLEPLADKTAYLKPQILKAYLRGLRADFKIPSPVEYKICLEL